MGLTANQLRKERKMQLLHLIKHDGSIRAKKLAGLYSLKTGLKTATISEMINELVDAELIVDDNGILSIKVEENV